MKINFDKNPVRFPHKMRGAFCYKRAVKISVNARKNRNEKLWRFCHNSVAEILVKTVAKFYFKMKRAHRERMRKWSAELCSEYEPSRQDFIKQ